MKRVQPAMNTRNKLNSQTGQKNKLKWEDAVHIRYQNMRTLGIREYQGYTRQVRLVYLVACLPGGCSSPGQALGNFTSRGFNETVQQVLVLPYIAACISSSASRNPGPLGGRPYCHCPERPLGLQKRTDLDQTRGLQDPGEDGILPCRQSIRRHAFGFKTIESFW